MRIEQYYEQKQKRLSEAPKYRDLCTKCIQPIFSCYCGTIKRFDPKIDFIILIHPIEVRRRIATGRMSHLCLANSQLIRGQDYSQNNDVNNLIADKNRHCVILYPGRKSKNISPMNNQERAELFPKDKRLTLFVIDGTWLTAKKMMNQSQNLGNLPRIGFTPEKPSTFRVRKQPHPLCYSTIEAIHHTIDLLGNSQGFDTESRMHDRLLNVFDYMVELQLEFIRKSHEQDGPARYRRGTRVSTKISF